MGVFVRAALLSTLLLAPLSASAMDRRPRQPEQEPYTFSMSTEAVTPSPVTGLREGDFYLALSPSLVGADGLTNDNCLGLSFVNSLRTLVNSRTFSVALTMRIARSSQGAGAAVLPANTPSIPIYMLHYDERADDPAQRCVLARFNRPLSEYRAHNAQATFIVEPQFRITNTPNYHLFSNIAGLLGTFDIAPIDQAGQATARDIDNRLDQLYGGGQTQTDSFVMSFAESQRARLVRAVHRDSRGRTTPVDLQVRLDFVTDISLLHDGLAIPSLASILSRSPPRVQGPQDTLNGENKAFAELFADGRLPLRPDGVPADNWNEQNWISFQNRCAQTRSYLTSTNGLSVTDTELVMVALLTQHAPRYFYSDRWLTERCMERQEAVTLLTEHRLQDELHRVEPRPEEGPSVPRVESIRTILDPFFQSLYIRGVDGQPGRTTTVEEFRERWNRLLGDSLASFVLVDGYDSAQPPVELTGAAALEHLSRYRGSGAAAYNANPTQSLSRGVIATLLASRDGQAIGDRGLVVESRQNDDGSWRITRVRIVPTYAAARAAIGLGA